MDPFVLSNHLSDLAIGQTLAWTGKTSGGRSANTVVDTQPVGHWSCKQLRNHGRRGDQTGEAPGLNCKVGENWHEVF